jgi:hypothetical protein
MRVPGYGEFLSSSNIHELYRHLLILLELLVVCMRFNIVCMHYGEQFVSIHAMEVKKVS